MPTLVDERPLQVNKYFPNPPGRPRGAKNKRQYVNIRAEMEKVYERMGGFDGLFQYATSEDGRPKFYEWFVKIFASFELKEQDQSHDPIRVLVYAADGSKVEIARAEHTEPIEALATEGQLDTPPGIDKVTESAT